MANLQKGTFNTIAQGSAEFGGHFPVWSRVDKLYQGGGFLDVADYNAGDVIGAYEERDGQKYGNGFNVAFIFGSIVGDNMAAVVK